MSLVDDSAVSLSCPGGEVDYLVCEQSTTSDTHNSVCLAGLVPCHLSGTDSRREDVVAGSVGHCRILLVDGVDDLIGLVGSHCHLVHGVLSSDHDQTSEDNNDDQQ